MWESMAMFYVVIGAIIYISSSGSCLDNEEIIDNWDRRRQLY
jgi:hypothetical protein